MSDETKLTDRFSIRPDTWNEGRYFLVGGPTIGAPIGTIADVAALGRALVAFAGGDAAKLPPADILNRVAIAGRAYLDADNEHRDEDGRTAAEHAFDRFVEAHEELAASAHLPPAAPLTVGAALGMPASQRREAVVEYVDEDGWWQARIDAEHNVQARALHTIGGTPRWPRRLWAYRVDGVALALPCRLVPLADADASPETRGPL